MKRIGLALVWAASTAFAQEPVTLTLEEAISIARENSKSLLVSGARVNSAASRAGEVETALYPNLFFYGGYVRLKPGTFSLATPGSPTPVSVGPVVDDTYTLQVGLRQPLFTGFSLSNNVRVAELEAEAARFEYQMEEADLVLNVTTAYWTLYQALQARRYAEENVARLRSYLADTEHLVAAGLATRNDRLKVEVQLASGKILQIEATNDVQLGMLHLNNVMGQPLGSEVRLASQPDAGRDGDGDRILAEREEPSALAERAWNARQDVQAFSARAEAARAGVDAAKGNWWPRLELTAHYLYNRPNSRYEPLTDEFIGSWDVGIQLAFDVWNWGATARQVEQAQARLRQKELQYDMLRDNVTLEVHSAALFLRRAKEKREVAGLAVMQAEESVRSTSDKYRSGLATSSELLDSEVSLLQAQTQYTGSEVEFALARARLRRAIGRGSEHDE
ncbi:MAG: TolC family protein [Bacteroidota bacterium]